MNDPSVNDVLLGVMGQPQKPPIMLRAFEEEFRTIAEALVRIANSAERGARAAEATQKDIAAMLKLAQHSR